MNKTHFEHLGIAIVFTLIGAAFGYAWIGAAFAIGIFVGREHAQREYKIGNPSKLVGYEALDFWRWSLDAKLDLLFPVVAAISVACVVEYVF